MDTTEYRGMQIVIEPETDAVENPYNEMDTLSEVVTWMRSHEFSSDGAFFSGSARKRGSKVYDSPEEIAEALESGELVYAAPLYAYVHGDITVNLGKMADMWPDKQWDCGLAGFVYVDRESAAKEFPDADEAKLRDLCAPIVESEVKILDQWLTGDVWYYAILDESGESVDSCGWIYGYDYAVQAAKEAVDYLVDKAPRQLPLPESQRAEIEA